MKRCPVWLLFIAAVGLLLWTAYMASGGDILLACALLVAAMIGFGALLLLLLGMMKMAIFLIERIGGC